MRIFFLLCFLLILSACAQDRIAKPEPLMSEEQLIDFHVDLALINASIEFNESHYVPLDSLYKFHGIDMGWHKPLLWWSPKARVK